MEEGVGAEMKSRVENLEFLERVENFVRRKHEGQLRKDGTPYVDHLIRVANNVAKFKTDEGIDSVFAAALLHDVLEDTDTGINELREEFGELITLLVVELTSNKLRIKEMGKAEYLSNKFGNSRKISNWGLVIKLADRLDNIADLDSFDSEIFEKKKKETEIFLDNLESERELTETHKKLVLAIREKLEGFDL